MKHSKNSAGIPENAGSEALGTASLTERAALLAALILSDPDFAKTYQKARRSGESPVSAM